MIEEDSGQYQGTRGEGEASYNSGHEWNSDGLDRSGPLSHDFQHLKQDAKADMRHLIPSMQAIG